MLACLIVDEAYHTIELTRLLEEVEHVSAIIHGLVQQENGSDVP